MESCAKAIAIENNWLFTEIDSQEIMLNLDDPDNNLKDIFKFAKKESVEQKSTYMLLVKNIEQLMNSN